MQKIIPHLWFAKEAKTAAEFYVSVFGGDSAVINTNILHGTPSGDAETVNFKIWDLEIMSISAGPYFKFNPSVSISAQCRSEEEIDRMYAALVEGGSVLMSFDWYPWGAKYAWINDRYGVSWQLNFFKDQGMVKDRMSPSLMFIGENTGKAEEAMQFYTSIFPDSTIDFIARYEEGESAADKPGTVNHGEFKLCGRTFLALDSALEHAFNFNEAVSLLVKCDSQEEIDRYWEKLSTVPEAEQCGWLKDRYGLSWQIVPAVMDEMMASGDQEKIARVTQAFLQMKKFDIARLQTAYDGQ